MAEGRIRLRTPEEQDREALLAWEADPELQELMGQGILGEDVFQNRFFWILEVEFRAIGWISLAHIDWRNRRAELRILIGERRYWGHGLGREAIRLLQQHATSEIRLREIFLRVHMHNRRAVRCYLGCGFTKQGILRGRKGKYPEYGPILLMHYRPEGEAEEAVSRGGLW